MKFKLQNTIAFKIGLLLFLIILVLLTNYGVLTKKVNVVNDSVSDILTISNNSITILEINKDIVELQRDVSVFGQTGSISILGKMATTQTSIRQRLTDVKRQTNNVELSALIDNMDVLVSRYGENLVTLEQLYDVKSGLIDEELPQLFANGNRLLAELSSIKGEQIAIIKSQNLWLIMERAATLFLNKKQYKQRSVANRVNRELSELLITLNPDTYPQLQKLLQYNDEFKQLFSRSVQANRNFLTLINVVMAGDAVEFTNQADLLKMKSLELLSEIKAVGAESVKITELIVKASIAVGLILFLGFALFFQLHISAAIKRLTMAFQSFLSGDFSPKITDTQRNDEIGLLAVAANEFKSMNESLMIAKREAEQTSKIKSEFLANMSHEIRTPMNGILGMVTLLGKTELSHQQSEMVEVIESSGKSLMVVLNDILDISKIESGHITLEQNAFDLNRVIVELEHMFRPLAETKQIDLNIVPVTELINYELCGDVTRLKQVLINLLSNAVKFTEVGAVALRIEVVGKQDTKITLGFKVVDTGIGIESRNIKKLFDAFSQADTSITRRFGGTGLGLAISSKLLVLMKAPLKVDSRVGKGSTFSFNLTLPYQLRDEVQGNDEELAEMYDTSVRILIAEDNKINQTVLVAMLKQKGFENVEIADNGELAVQACHDASFDLIFMDMQMPQMDGIQATKLIRKMPQYNKVKIVALTANVLAEDRQACFDAGMDEFLAKPIEADKLFAVFS